MSKFGKLGVLVAASLFVGSTAIASTVSITAMDFNGMGDDVMFDITNNSDDAINMLLFDVSVNDPGVAARFNRPTTSGTVDAGLILDNGRSTGIDGSINFEFINNDNDSDFEQLKFTFADGDFGLGDVFAFDAWIQYLNDETAGGQRGGLDDDGDRLFASVYTESGLHASGFFSDVFDGNGSQVIDKAQIELAPVPLPASALLLLGGVAGLGAGF